MIYIFAFTLLHYSVHSSAVTTSELQKNTLSSGYLPCCKFGKQVWN